MLVLKRKRDEKIVIDGHIVITVIDGDATRGVRLGIDAPLDVTIDREEVHLAKRRGEEPPPRRIYS